jgi:hypothetical protein
VTISFQLEPGQLARQTSDEDKGLRAEAQQLKELLAEVLLEKFGCSKKGARHWGVRYMR